MAHRAVTPAVPPPQAQTRETLREARNPASVREVPAEIVQDRNIPAERVVLRGMHGEDEATERPGEPSDGPGVAHRWP
jgi:hypothetical protein